MQSSKLTKMVLRKPVGALPLYLLFLVLVSSVLSVQAQEESFPSCVEILSIYPPPYSVVKVHKDQSIRFEITFSKPVVNTRPKHDWIFLSPYSSGTIVRKDRVQTPDRIQRSSTSTRRFTVKFTIKKPVNNYFGTKFKTFYLVIDGGIFYALERIQIAAYHRTFVPLAMFGEYYTDLDEKLYRGNKTEQPLTPSPYCRPAQFRHRPQPVERSAVIEKFAFAEIPERGHLLDVKDDATTLEEDTITVGLLALVNVTEGKAMVDLPRSVTVQLHSVNYTALLPTWTLSFDFPLIWYKMKATPKLVYDLVERVYLSRNQTYGIGQIMTGLIAELRGIPFPRRPGLWQGSKHKVHVIEVFDADTNVKLIQFVKEKRYWYERTYSGRVYNAFKLHHTTLHSQPENKKFLQNNMRQCPVDSRRNRGRTGRLYHTVEYGQFYQVLALEDPSRWDAHLFGKGNSHDVSVHVTANTSKGEKMDLSKQAQIGWNNKKIPSRLVKALSEDYVCLLKSPVKSRTNAFALEEKCIFVPKSVAVSSQCGGLRLFKNVSGVINDPDFCNKDLGDCIGEPFSSLKRFPVIHPFGLPELSGWTVISLDGLHDAAGSSGPHPKQARAHAAFKSRAPSSTSMDSYLCISPFSHLNQMDVHHIPISGAKLAFPHVKFTSQQFCNSVWKIKTQADAITEALLTASINNTGEGGGDFVFEVKCSAHLQVYPASGTIKQWIPPMSTFKARFKLSTLLDSHKRASHQYKCKLSLHVPSAKELSTHAQRLPNCTKTITTHRGAFKDPCNLEEERLPAVNLMYYVLPASELEPLARDGHLHQRANLPTERNFSLVKAITISLDIPEHQHDLILNLKQLHVHCGNAAVLLTQSYGEFLVHQATGGIPGFTTPKHPLVFFGGDIDQNTVYYFLPKEESGVKGREEAVYSDCWAELWANRPHPLCDQPTLIARMAVPLTNHDQTVLDGSGSKSYTSVVYGGRTSGIVTALLAGSLLLSAVLCTCGCTGHGILFALSKKLPRNNTLKKYQKDLKRARAADAEEWDSPQMFLTKGPHGPYYLLHSFRATDALDTTNLKSLKIAGTLRYKNKQLQVLFGHVKTVYLDKSGKTKDIWIQASSGMYLLSLQHVKADYKADYCRLLKRHGVKVGLAEME